ANSGTTGATISGATFTATAAGTATVRATIVNGASASTDYTQDFTITVNAPTPVFVAVTNISGVPTSATAGTSLTLAGTVSPADATNSAIVWSIANAGTTGATISGATFTAAAAGTATVRATVVNGLTASTDYTQDFTITVNAAPPVAPSIYTTSLPDANEGESYGEYLSAAGDGPLRWSIIAGELPYGLTLYSDGYISGTLDASGTFTFTVEASNDYGADARRFSIYVAPIPTYSVTFNLIDQFGEPVDDAVITIDGESYPAGTTVITDLPPGTYEYTITAPDHNTVTGYVTVGNGDVTVNVPNIISTVGNASVSVAKIWTSGRTLFVALQQQSDIQIYSITGALVRKQTLSAGDSSFTLNAGIYIVKVNGLTRKAIIK
ncbi:MAG: T9SS type A sorting domain-containing protein, partial [Tannerella sp.]|nr:T9SS type A sorting domain-containing protein [Tannerella sp.]